MSDVPSTIGPYEIRRELGRGGMGVVYLARDTRLDRDVAIKALPAELAADPARLERFEREAKLLAGLSHPNIAGIYGVEERDGAKYLVLEYVEGETLADRLDRGPLPLHEALEVAVQITAGLEAAHEAGVIHRDLKPGNVILTPEGKATVLDFGLARSDDGSLSSSSAPDSPTMTTPQHSPTIEGAILGTAGYMSPEQARGRRVDKRTDLWSFGVVLFEMLVGSNPFLGETTGDTIGAVLHKEFTLDGLPAGTPRMVRHVLARCLDRDRTRRLQSIGDARIELEDAIKRVENGESEPADARASSTARRVWPAIAASIAALVVGALVGISGWKALTPAVEPRPALVLDVAAPPGLSLGSTSALSPDGKRLALTVRDDDEEPRLWIRTLATGESEMVPDSSGAANPFWAPNGTAVGFFADARLHVADLDRDDTWVIADAPGERTSGTWGRDDIIVFSSEFGVPLKKLRVGERASPTPLQEAFGFRPFFLPDGQHVLAGRGDQNTGIFVVDIISGEVTPLRSDGSEPKYVDGYLLFGLGGQLVAQPFNVDTFELTGEPTALADFGRHNGNLGPNFSVAGDRLIALASQEYTGLDLVWYSRDGTQTLADDSGDAWWNPQLSFDDAFVAAVYFDKGVADLWLHDVALGESLRFASRLGPLNPPPFWSPDGQIWFARSVKPDSDERVLVESAVEGGVEHEWPYPAILFLTGKTPDGGFLGFGLVDGNRDVRYQPPGESRARPFAQTPANETQPALSPDGRWLAYVSDARGGEKQRDILVEAFPDGGQKVRASRDLPGVQPVWRKDGRELFYLGSDQRLMAVSVEHVDGTLRLGAPRPLFQTKIYPRHGLGTRALYDATRDGSRFIAVEPREERNLTLTVLVDWKSKLGAGR